MGKIPNLDQATRLQLIMEAIKYCRYVKAMGMPAAGYTKALREPFYFLWNKKSGGNKAKIAKYISREAVGKKIGKGELILDHAIPFNYLQERLLNIPEISAESVEKILTEFDTFVLITKEEDKLLGRYRAKMPEGWDKVNPLARYNAVGIDLVDNKN